MGKQENKQNASIQNAEISERLMKTKRKITEISVDIEPSEVFSDAAKYVIASAERIFRNSNNAPIVDIKVLEQYFFDALVHRVASCNLNSKPNRVLRARAMNYPLPAIVYNAIRQVGQATDKAFNIRFNPTMSLKTLNTYQDVKLTYTSKLEDKDEALADVASKIELNCYSDYVPLSEDDFDKCLNMFMAMEEEGYVVTGALSKEIYGDINFMAMTNVENQTSGPRSYRDTNPVYAFYRSFFYNQQLASLCDTIYTYQYNDMEEMALVLKDICFGKNNIPSVTQVLSEYR